MFEDLALFPIVAAEYANDMESKSQRNPLHWVILHH